jgi:hypothetical protein
MYLEELSKIKKTSIGKAGVPTEIWTKHLPNINLERYTHTKLLGSSLEFALGVNNSSP